MQTDIGHAVLIESIDSSSIKRVADDATIKHERDWRDSFLPAVNKSRTVFCSCSGICYQQDGVNRGHFLWGPKRGRDGTCMYVSQPVFSSPTHMNVR